MIENFKITAFALKRQLRCSIYLPDDYNETNRSYPLIYILDGQRYFRFLDDSKREFDLSSIMQENEFNAIIVGIHAPDNSDWRLSELVSYFKPNGSIVDPKLSPVFLNYIENELDLIIHQKYRVLDPYIYMLGINEGAIFSLYTLLNSKKINDCAIISPSLNICDIDLINLDILANNKIKNCYINNDLLANKLTDSKINVKVSSNDQVDDSLIEAIRYLLSIRKER